MPLKCILDIVKLTNDKMNRERIFQNGKISRNFNFKIVFSSRIRINSCQNICLITYKLKNSTMTCENSTILEKLHQK